MSCLATRVMIGITMELAIGALGNWQTLWMVNITFRPRRFQVMGMRRTSSYSARSEASIAATFRGDNLLKVAGKARLDALIINSLVGGDVKWPACGPGFPRD